MKEELNRKTKAVFADVLLLWCAFLVFFVVRSGKRTIVRQIEEKGPVFELKNQASDPEPVQDWSSEKISILKRAYLERIYQQTESEK